MPRRSRAHQSTSKIVKEIIEERAAYANSDPAEDEVTNDKSGRQLQGYTADEVAAEYEDWMSAYVHPSSRSKANQWR